MVFSPRDLNTKISPLTRQTALFQFFHKIVSLNVSELISEISDGKIRAMCYEVFKHESTGAFPRTQVAVSCDFW